MDEDGYPEPMTLDAVARWDASDFDGLAKFLADLWIYPTYVDYDEERGVLRIATGGWSGHESLLDEIPRAWRLLHWWSSRRGGLHYFTRGGFDPRLPNS